MGAVAFGVVVFSVSLFILLSRSDTFLRLSDNFDNLESTLSFIIFEISFFKPSFVLFSSNLFFILSSNFFKTESGFPSLDSFTSMSFVLVSFSSNSDSDSDFEIVSIICNKFLFFSSKLIFSFSSSFIIFSLRGTFSFLGFLLLTLRFFGMLSPSFVFYN